MTASRIPTRQRIVNTALQLFARQGITETTTRQIADQAEINEVTLFRHFGNKHGLLLAVLQECLQQYLLLTQVGESIIITEMSNQGDLSRFLRYYMQNSLRLLESVPELLRSLVGEAGQYPSESRQALAQGIAQINQSIATVLEDVMAQTQTHYPLAPIKLANLVNTCLLGYAVIMLTSDIESIWSSSEDFINTLVEMIVKDTEAIQPVIDIPTETVRNIMLLAKRQGLREYAIAYLLFGAGLSAAELVQLRRDDYLTASSTRVLKIGSLGQRLVPINQNILGQRYGSGSNNPLTAYLKSRKDQHPAMFLDADHQPLSLTQLEQIWRGWAELHRNPDGSPVLLEQARQTWGLDMLVRGMDVDNFCIISGLSPHEIQPYLQRVKEKAAIHQAITLDA
ncbi:TetR family transcriptional regulator [Tumidithrix elongata RA019]|uniref:TetR family transcriptional regulator n=1 Tax=Tumidithrix elongata BACA0141 TaxID=2716417 RepID=A0AAW9Q108_9CYAN|nr:TetR family transcriptional regulator [Tumidithrix elongata RA019]